MPYRKPRTRPKDLVRLGVFVPPNLRKNVKQAARDANLTIEAWATDAFEQKLAQSKLPAA